MSEQQYGTIEIAGKDISLMGIKYDRIAVGGGNRLLMASVVAETQKIKAVRAILNGGARCSINASGARIVRPHCTWAYPRHPGRLEATADGYAMYTHKLDYGLAHAMLFTRMPGFMRVVNEPALWQELNDTRFTTPILRSWMPYITEKLKARDLLEDAEAFNVSCGVLNATTADLDDIVSGGIKAGELRLSERTAEPEPEPTEEEYREIILDGIRAEDAARAEGAPRSWKVAVKVTGQDHPSYNACRYTTREDADAAASDLYSRWTTMTGWEIEPCDDEPNR
jgi:hypothetical protein